jgi:hypothetical protein
VTSGDSQCQEELQFPKEPQPEASAAADASSPSHSQHSSIQLPKYVYQGLVTGVGCIPFSVEKGFI